MASKFLITALLAALTLGTATGCSGLLYQPDRVLYVGPKQMDYKPQEVKFKDADGTELGGWYFRQPNPEKAKARLLFFHGNAQNISSHFLSLYWLVEFGYEFFIFDYPGYGPSQGKPTPQNTVSAGLAAARWLSEQKPPRPMGFFGQSLGGAVAMTTVLEFKKEEPLCLVAVDSTFASYKAVARDILSNHWLTWILQPLTYLVLSDQYAPRERVKEISPIPLLVIHGEKDPIIPFHRGEEVFNLAKEPKEFWPVAGGRHIGAFNAVDRDIYRRRFVKSLEQHCSAKP